MRISDWSSDVCSSDLDEAGDYERAIINAADCLHPGADSGSEDNEIKRRSNHRRGQAGPKRPPEASQFEPVNGKNAAKIEAGHACAPPGACTRLTKMSSSEDRKSTRLNSSH